MEQLPTNILVKIFESLNNLDLISLSCTCKKFLEVTTNFMPLKFPPVRVDFKNLYYTKLQKFTYKDGKDFNVLIETTRHYQNYIFLNFNKEHTDRLGDKWLQLLKRQINARTIRIKSDCMDLHQLCNMLKLTHRLVYLEIDGYRLAQVGTKKTIDESDAANLPFLKHLRIHSFLDTTPHLFMIFQGCKTLKTISLSALFMVNKKIKPINDLIYNQRILEQLELIGLDSHNGLFEDLSEPVPFKLEKLNIDFNGYSMNLQKFFEFIQGQNFLKEIKLAFDLRHSLQFTHDLNLCHEIIRYCMTLETVASLNLLVNKFVQKDMHMICQDFRINRSIKRLTFENESRDKNNILILLLKNLPNLKYLELACDYDEEVLSQLSHLNKLKHLKLTDYHQGLLKSVKCSSSLESIALKYCYTRNNGSEWLVFLNSHPKISHIHIDNSIDFLDDAIIELIAGSCGKNLEYFVMCDSVATKLSENAFKSFQKHCPHIKRLELTNKPNKRTENKHQSFHNMLANIKCIICFYVICIILFVTLILLMIFEKI